MKVQLVNLPRFTAALRNVSRVSRKSEAEIVTRACRDVGYRAAQFSPFATPAAIESGVRHDGILVKLASLALNRTKGPGNWNRADLAEMARKILAKRKSGSRAIRAGWIPGIQALGGSFRGAKLKSAGSAAHGTGRPASITRLSAMIRNSIRTTSATGQRTDAGEIEPAVRALNLAIEFVSADRELYAAKKRMASAIKSAAK